MEYVKSWEICGAKMIIMEETSSPMINESFME
jgi:hypothetical protein